MNTNTSSTTCSAGRPDRLAALAAAVDDLAAQDLDGLPDAVRAERVLVLRRLLDRLEGSTNSPASMPTAPPAPSRDNRPPRPLAGCEAGCA